MIQFDSSNSLFTRFSISFRHLLLKVDGMLPALSSHGGGGGGEV